MDGIIVVNKDSGCTSHDVVYTIRKMFGEKVGHSGTLDPNASGVLPILIGKGTGVSQYLINHDKKYIATIKLGERTDTADVEGKVIEVKEVDDDIFVKEKLEEVLKSMVGKQKQRPPMYSAIKINGKKLYEYARSGKSVDIPERDIEIYDMKLIDFDKKEKTVVFEVFCSKGTYIRTVCESIAKKLNTVGYMKGLERTMVGDFTIKNSITVSELKKKYLENSNTIDLKKNLEEKKDEIYTQNYFISIEQFFKEKPSIKLNDKQIKLLLNGVLLDCENGSDIVRIYNSKDEFIGIGTVSNGKIKRNIIMNVFDEIH